MFLLALVFAFASYMFSESSDYCNNIVGLLCMRLCLARCNARSVLIQGAGSLKPNAMRDKRNVGFCPKSVMACIYLAKFVHLIVLHF